MSRNVSSIYMSSYETIAGLLTATMIMTPKEELCVFKASEKISRVLATMEEKNYDVAPIDDNGTMGTFVEREKLREGDLSLPCEEACHSVLVKHIVSEQAKIESLLALFTHQDFFFVIGPKDITGMVTYADLNKRAVKVLFYLLISELEMRLLDMIKRRFPKIEDSLSCLSAKQRREIEETVRASRKGNTDISLEQYFCTRHIITIVSKDALLRNQLGFRSRLQAKKTLNPIVELRNRTMHPRPLMTQKADVKTLKQKYDILSKLIQVLQS